MKTNNNKALVMLCFICSLLASSIAFGGEWGDRKAISRQAETAFVKRDYAKLEKLAEHYRKTEERTHSGIWKLDWFYDGVKSAIHGNHKNEQSWQRSVKAVDEWLAVYPDSISAHLTKAWLFNSKAWAYRGNKFYQEVPKQDIKVFHEYVNKTIEYLSKHRKLIADTDPYFWALAIGISTGAPTDEIKGLVKEGLKRFPNYYQISFHAHIPLLPQWGGSYDEIEWLTNYAVKASSATEGNSLYARSYWSLSAKIGEDIFYNPKKKTKMDWNKMKLGMIDVVERYPVDWNIDKFVKFSCWSGDQDMVFRLLKYKKEPISEQRRKQVQSECVKERFINLSRNKSK